MTDIVVVVLLQPSGTVFRPGERIRGLVKAEFERDVPSGGGIHLKLGWRTSGRGTVEQGTAAEELLVHGPFLSGERQELPFDLECPAGPFSASNDRVSISWELEAWVETGWRHVPVDRVPVEVVAGPCERPFLGAEQEDILAVPPRFLSTASEGKGFHALAALTGVGIACSTLGAIVGEWWIIQLGGVVAAGALVGALGWYGLQVGRRQRFGGLEVELPGGRLLATGEALDGWLHFTPDSDGRVVQLAAGWMLEERAENVEGTSTNVFHGEVLRVMQPMLVEPVECVAGQEISLPFHLEVPTAPSFRGSRNWLSWSLLVRVQLGDATEVLHQVPVCVRPPRPGGEAASAGGREQRGIEG
jgi:hypothetical protein